MKMADEPVKPACKKRGRKPRGGRIVGIEDISTQASKAVDKAIILKIKKETPNSISN